MNHIGIKLQLPKPAQPVERRELTITTNGDTKTYLLPGSVTVSDELVFVDTDSYKATLVDIDVYGNRSLPSDTLSVNLKEEMRPAKPEPLIVEKSNKRFLTEEDMVRIREDNVRKAAEVAKAEQAKAVQVAKDEETLRVAHEKLDADAKAAAEKKQPLHQDVHQHAAKQSPPTAPPATYGSNPR